MNNLKDFRVKEQLTQKELAKILSITHDYVSVLETGKRTPGFKLAQNIADLFGATVDDLNFFNATTNKLNAI